MNDTEALKKKLEDLKKKHRQLDGQISTLMETRPTDQLETQRLKKRKLALKDEIIQVENRLLPDIIA